MVAPVREYERQFGANLGDPGRRATAEDMGFAPGIADLAQGIGRASVMLQKHEEDQELSDAQIKIAKAENEWDQRQKAIQEKATPGVSTAEQLRTEMSDYYSQMAGNYKTDKARKYVQIHGINQTGNRAKQAMAFDADLYARDQSEKRSTLRSDVVSFSYDNPDKAAEKLARLQFDFEQKIGVFSTSGDPRIDVAMGKFMRETENEVAWASALGSVQKNPVIRRGLSSFSGASSLTFDDVFSRLIQTESSGKHRNKDGTLVRSDKDALGITQVLPATAKDPGFGVKPLQNDSEAEYIRFGKDYLTALNTEFGGDMRKALAAYNGGHANVKKAVSKNGENWLSAMPQETQKYVEKIAGRGDGEVPENVQGIPLWGYLKPDQKYRLINMAEQQDRKENAVAQASARHTIEDIDKHFKTYMKLPKEVMSPSVIRDPAERQVYESKLAAYTALERVGNVPIDQQLKELEKLRPQIGTGQEPGVYARQESIYQAATKLAVEMDKERREDPLTVAYTQTYSTENPIKPIQDFSDPAKLAEEIKIRAPQADAYNTQFKTGKNSKLMNHEASNLRATLDSMPAKEIASWVDSFSRGVNNPKVVADVFGQVAKGDGALMAVGVIAATHIASPAKKADDSNAILFGRSIIKMNEKGEDNKDIKGIKGLVVPTDEQIVKEMAVHSGAVNLPPDQYAAYAEAVKSHFVGKSVSAGITNNSLKDKEEGDANKKRLHSSIDAIMGAPTVAGNSRVIRPYGMDETSFINAVQSEVNDKFGGKYNWGEYSLQSMPDGRYAVSIGGEIRSVINPVDTHMTSLVRSQIQEQSGSTAVKQSTVSAKRDVGFKEAMSGRWSVGGSAPSIYTDLK